MITEGTVLLDGATNERWTVTNVQTRGGDDYRYQLDHGSGQFHPRYAFTYEVCGTECPPDARCVHPWRVEERRTIAQR
jgi:hypothetical protein